MNSESSLHPDDCIHVFFIPWMAPGHLIPMTDLAKLFALRDGVRSSIVATPFDVPRIRTSIRGDPHSRPISAISILPIDFPDGSEGYRTTDVTSSGKQQTLRKAAPLLRPAFERLVEVHRPDCIVYDRFLPWAVDVAFGFDIPGISFNGDGFFSSCVHHSIERHLPQESAAGDFDPFPVPGLPHHVEMTCSQIPFFLGKDGQKGDHINVMKESERKSFGVIKNTFYALEPDYVNYFREEVIRSDRAWHVGPVSLIWSRDLAGAAERGRKAAVEPKRCSDWLDSRETGSVLYICFGSISQMGGEQLEEIALALEQSGCPFLWAVSEEEERVPAGLEEKGQGLVIRGWAPQVMILGHRAVGAFMTHCGWNSVLESVAAGVPMVTWPLGAEQFSNEKLITRVLGIGVGVGSMEWGRSPSERKLIGREAIRRAVAEVMRGGEKEEEMRRRARELSEAAERAMEVGGSSFQELGRLIEEVKMCRVATANQPPVDAPVTKQT